MNSPPVIRINQMLNLLTALLLQFLEKGEQLKQVEFNKFFAYSMAWALGGLFETEEREKFHKYMETKGAPLP